MAPPDPKSAKRIRDPALLAGWHLTVKRCAIEDDTCEPVLSIHHIHKHPRDDVSGNIAMICGSGTTGHHGLIEAHDRETCDRFQAYLRETRPDVMEYLAKKLKGEEARDEWLRRHL